MGIGGSVTLGVVNMVSGGVNLTANHRNTYGKGGSVILGVVNMVSGGVNLRANQRNCYGNMGIGNFGRLWGW